MVPRVRQKNQKTGKFKDKLQTLETSDLVLGTNKGFRLSAHAAQHFLAYLIM